MADVLAIISKVAFEAIARERGSAPAVGDVVALDCYASTNPQLKPLAAGGTLYLVTVRPPGEALWLVAILERPRFDGTAWLAQPNAEPIRDVSALRAAIRFDSGKGMAQETGRLAMSLQTPRTLTPEDASLITSSRVGPPLTARVDVEESDAPEHAPRYEKQVGAGRRFWQVDRRGCEVTTWFGFVGRKGRSVSRMLPDPSAAKLEVGRLVSEKRAEGYVQAPPRTWASTSVRGTCRRSEEMEALIEAALDEPDVYWVYGDWLSSQGDPRGELMAVQRARLANLDSPILLEREREVLKKFSSELLGPLARFQGTSHAMRGFHWSRGFIERARFHRRSIKPTLDDLLRMFFDHPSARFVRHLTLGPSRYKSEPNSYEDAITILRERAPRSLHSLHVGEGSPELGNLSTLLDAAPNVRRLALTGSDLLFHPRVADNVHELTVYLSGDAHPSPDGILGRAVFSSLRHLRIQTAYGAMVTTKELAGFTPAQFPALRKVTAHCRVINEHRSFAGIERWPILSQLDELDLDVPLDDPGADCLERYAARFAHLSKLRLGSGRSVSASKRKQLGDALPNLVWTSIARHEPFDEAFA